MHYFSNDPELQKKWNIEKINANIKKADKLLKAAEEQWLCYIESWLSDAVLKRNIENAKVYLNFCKNSQCLTQVLQQDFIWRLFISKKKTEELAKKAEQGDFKEVIYTIRQK